jgi:hypothetical protein
MTAAPDLAFYDAWAVAEDGTVGTGGRTAILLPQSAPTQARRFDFNFSAWLRRGGVGNPRICALLRVRPPDELRLSDHPGVVADLWY